MRRISLSISSRKLGKCLTEIPRYKHDTHVIIYRAIVGTKGKIQNMDYVSLSFKWAKGHAEHNFAVNEETCAVLFATVPVSCVFEASNPDEYFYHGPELKARIAYLTGGKATLE